MVAKPPQAYGAFAGTAAPNQAGVQHRKQRIWSILIAILVGLIIGSAIFYRFTNIIPSGAKTQTPGASTIVAKTQTPSVGDVSFFNTRQLTDTGTPGINDGIQVNLNLPSQPATGQRYYAWLQDSNIEGTSILLNRTAILKQGSNSLAYIDPQHHNLLATMSQFLSQRRVLKSYQSARHSIRNSGAMRERSHRRVPPQTTLVNLIIYATYSQVIPPSICFTSMAASTTGS